MASVPSTLPDDRLLEEATQRHRAGDIAGARDLYDRLLSANPTHPMALFRRALLALQDGKPGPALTLIERAAAAAPDLPGLDAARGHALQSAGRWADAVAAYRCALRTRPDDIDVQFALGNALQSLGCYPQAIAAFENTIGAQPDHFAALNNLGICQQRTGQYADAVASYERALQQRPQSAGTIANLGTVLQTLGRLDEAVLLLRTAATLEPTVSAHAVNLAIALCKNRAFTEAAALLQGVLAADPAQPDATFNLGHALHGLGATREAAACFAEAAALRPGYTDAWVNLGNMHRELGELLAAEQSYESAIRCDPRSVVALNNFGCLLRLMGRLDDAEDALREALRYDPLHAALHDNLGSVLKDAGEIDAAIACFSRSLELDPSNPTVHGNLAYALCFQSADAGPIFEETVLWGRRFADPLTKRARPHDNDRRPGRRLRVGYLSPDFREHCQSLFTLPLLAHHDRTGFEIFCYSSVERPDEKTRRIAELADAWRDVRALDDAALAEQIRADGIDVLVDLTLHMARGRPLVLARKPAPVQVGWLAYPGSTGMAAMDYRISDPRLDPPGADGAYRETTLRLPDSFWCYDPLTGGPPVNALPALARGHVTFGCLNNPCKLTQATLQLWGGVMRAVPDARLRLLAPEGRHRTRLSQRLRAHGIASERVEFVPYRARPLYLQAYHDIDVGLDTFPYNGHTTSLDSLWMGVPTLTRVGDTCVGRGGLSQLFQLGLTEFAACTDAEFIAAASDLAGDIARLSALRHELRPRLSASPLMDAPRFARSIESLYREIWRRHCDT